MEEEKHFRWGVTEVEGWRKGPWTAEEDNLLIQYVNLHGEGRWSSVSKLTGLKRNGKSCRLRWVNYLRPDLKRGQITPHEENIILELHARWGNRWSTIARSLPGRTDNEIKNYWRTHFKKKPKASCATNIDKARSRLLKKQHFQQQQQQQQFQQQQHVNQMDMKRMMMFLLDENDNRMTYVPNKHDTTTTYQNNTVIQEHGQWDNNSIFNGGYYAETVTVPEPSSEEGFLWDGLWELNDILANQNTTFGCNKADVTSLSTPF